MTVDFRPPQERGEPADPQAAALMRGRRVVHGVLVATAVGMVAAGGAIWWLHPAFLPPDTHALVAMAFVLAGVFDGLMAWGLGRWWLRR